MQKIVTYLFLSLLFSSCYLFNNSKKKIIEQEIDTINFSEVDVYPSFKICDSIINNEDKKKCFQITIHQYLSQNLKTLMVSSISSKINEKIIIYISIKKNGEITLDEIVCSDYLKKEFPELNQILIHSINQLPRVFPALKRGIPVNSQYQIPIKITVN